MANNSLPVASGNYVPPSICEETPRNNSGEGRRQGNYYRGNQQRRTTNKGKI